MKNRHSWIETRDSLANEGGQGNCDLESNNLCERKALEFRRIQLT
jgi:hypothetical protein